jgi:Sulfotransferase domain
MLPTFIGIGAQRAGTTWAYNCLAQHPEVFMSEQKELHFFYAHYDRGMSWYEDQFVAAGGAIARGEISPDYMYSSEALHNIARDLPEVRLFAILRNPIDRAISAYVLRDARNEGLSFGDACRRFPVLIERGMYCRHLDAIFALFPPERLKVLLYDDLVARPDAFLDELFSFIGVRTGVRPTAMGTRYNRVIYPGLQKALIRARLGWTIEALKRTAAGGWIRRRNAAERRSSGIARQADLEHLRTVFADDVAELSQRLGRDLTGWLR